MSFSQDCGLNGQKVKTVPSQNLIQIYWTRRAWRNDCTIFLQVLLTYTNNKKVLSTTLHYIVFLTLQLFAILQAQAYDTRTVFVTAAKKHFVPSHHPNPNGLRQRFVSLLLVGFVVNFTDFFNIIKLLVFLPGNSNQCYVMKL